MFPDVYRQLSIGHIMEKIDKYINRDWGFQISVIPLECVLFSAFLLSVKSTIVAIEILRFAIPTQHFVV